VYVVFGGVGAGVDVDGVFAVEDVVSSVVVGVVDGVGDEDVSAGAAAVSAGVVAAESVVVVGAVSAKAANGAPRAISTDPPTNSVDLIMRLSVCIVFSFPIGELESLWGE